MKSFIHFLNENSGLLEKIKKLRPAIVKAVQKVYDEWTDNDEGGICDSISGAIAHIISDIEGITITDGGHDGDDHAWIICYNDKEAYGIDINPHVYETGGGYRWHKIDGVEFDIGDIDIFPLKLEDIKE